jgi:hypothetical protein
MMWWESVQPPLILPPPGEISRTRSRTASIAIVRPLLVKVNKAIDNFCNELPMKLAAKIVAVEFGPDGVMDPSYRVSFIGGKVINFYNVDDFPTDADIARIAVECP